MKSLISKKRVKIFEREQADAGTKIAISNLIWDLAFELYGAIGVKHVKTTYFKNKK